MATVAADFWLVSLVTLGLSRQACDRYEARVLDRAMELVERYNRAEFAAWGIVARLHVVAPPAYTSSRRSHDGHSSPRLRLTLELTVGPA
ncbi:hypothetical protein H4R19_005435 [Coemansia spiralis]|nr:hypothetical protein H4R19_005435 [Coemansia spiralis]